MNLKVVGSGSSGNCYLLENDDECLVIEAGAPIMNCKKALDFNIRKIKGVIVTHNHGDHAKYVNDFHNMGICTFTPYSDKGVQITRAFGNFLVKTFPNRTSDGKWLHNNSDGSECPCYGFWIYHKEINRLVYASDTECIVQRFRDLNHILIEANYSQDLVDRDSVKFNHQIRGHMSIDTACNFLEANRSDKLRNVILCHLSSTASDTGAFIERARQVVDCNVEVARKGLEVNLSETLF